MSRLERDEIRRRLEEARDFDEVFRLVKRVVRERMGMNRAGLMLALADIPSEVLAYHVVGTNLIVINRILYEQVRSQSRDRTLVNSYLFVVLLHEYLHSLGVTDEIRVRALTARLTQDSLGSDHLAYTLSSKPIQTVLPQLLNVRPMTSSDRVELVKEFDRESVTYIF
ncbi:MAG: hypothetical protein NZ920_03350 [Aigarchaeota archaeon]|nr:hypothetical protein [Aigarchaeota archaeon]MDW8092345.1 hypothetical protein [Nitrososphaerota archaeon]